METNNEYAVCLDCNRPMTPRSGCLVTHIRIKGKEYERIKSGITPGYDADMGESYICHDCNVGAGQYHHLGCDMERCPVCNGQLISCGCWEE